MSTNLANLVRNAKKTPRYDLISGEILKQLPRKAIVKLTCLFNSAFSFKYVPRLWKCGEVVMIHKPGKDINEVQSYQPIFLLPVISKIEKSATNHQRK